MNIAVPKPCASSNAPETPGVSLIIELENTVFAGQEQSSLMLAALDKQLPRFFERRGRSIEMLVVFDPIERNQPAPELALSQAAGAHPILTIRTIAAQAGNYFFANNVAFRRQLFQKCNFPSLPRLRGRCAALADTLRRDGSSLMLDPRAWVSHPPPNGVNYFLSREILASPTDSEDEPYSHGWCSGNCQWLPGAMSARRMSGSGDARLDSPLRRGLRLA